MILAAISWSKLGIVLGLVAGLAIIFAALILIVTKVCHIEEDEKVLKILENLAGANCGGCGHTGCEGFAKSLADGKACLNDCKATSDEAKAIIAKISGIPFEAEDPTMAVVHCNGGIDAEDKFEYVGNEGCRNQMIYHDGRKICQTACLGGGSCERACPVNAIAINEKGLAEVNPAICTSCGACIMICPRNAIGRIPQKARVYVACSSRCRGKEVMNFCKAGCIGCGLCAKNCPQKAITMENNLPVIDYSKCDGCLTCVAKCPRKCMKEVKAK
jgi:Na+-translocating ferredoxin:NAD+ oxidoreductase RNF subunit RnfB